MERAFQEGGPNAQRHGGVSGDGAFGKLRIRDCWCSDSQGGKSVKCVPVTVFWELKDCILSLDTPILTLGELVGVGSGGQGACGGSESACTAQSLHGAEALLQQGWPLYCFPRASCNKYLIQ